MTDFVSDSFAPTLPSEGYIPEIARIVPLSPNEVHIFIDIETFGLDVLNHGPLEIGFVITDLEFNVLATRSWLVWESHYPLELDQLHRDADRGDEGSQIVLNMHGRSNLFEDAKRWGKECVLVEREAIEWFEAMGLKKGESSMTGSSVSFDRWVTYFNSRALYNWFHYRIVDVSSLKVLFKKYDPELADELEKDKPKGSHRVISDCMNTIDELKKYIDYIFPIGE